MAKCKITVLETQFNEKLAKEYGVENIGPCPFHKVGQIFETPHWTDSELVFEKKYLIPQLPQLILQSLCS